MDISPRLVAMGGVMKSHTPETQALHAFLSAVRSRLWANQALQVGHRLLWQIGLLILVVAVIDYFIVAVPGLLTLAGVVILVAAALLQGILGRPTLRATAAQTDREFGGHALMTTAVECLQHPAATRSAASTVVLQQAGDAAQSWAPEVSKTFVPPQVTKAALAIIPIFAAVVLLSIPDTEVGEEIVAIGARTLAGNAKSDDGRTRADIDNLKTLRDALDNEKQSPDGRAALTTHENESNGALAPRDSASHASEDPALLPPPSSPGRSLATQPSDDGVLPSDAAARATARAQDTAAPMQFRGREVIDIQGSGDGGAAGAGRNTAYDDTASATQTPAPNVLPAAAPATRTQWTMLTPAQAAYARRYLEKTGNSYE